MDGFDLTLPFRRLSLSKETGNAVVGDQNSKLDGVPNDQNIRTFKKFAYSCRWG
ncbi:hypothetical protein GGC47_004436 [Bosea sp. OAE752]|jgi:hypothetical protein|uniref:hypothetical protein n=1 Tax=Bosea sp. OAE752 TaxID=2663873 RepID=UPI0011731975